MLAGNSATSSAVVYTLSTTAPTVSEALTIDTGTSADDHITSNDALSGSGLANRRWCLHHRRHLECLPP